MSLFSTSAALLLSLLAVSTEGFTWSGSLEDCETFPSTGYVLNSTEDVTIDWPYTTIASAQQVVTCKWNFKSTDMQNSMKFWQTIHIQSLTGTASASISMVCNNGAKIVPHCTTKDGDDFCKGSFMAPCNDYTVTIVTKDNYKAEQGQLLLRQAPLQICTDTCGDSNVVLTVTSPTTTLSTPNYPTSFCDIPVDCEWKITAPDGYFVELTALKGRTNPTLRLGDSNKANMLSSCAPGQHAECLPRTTLGDNSTVTFTYESPLTDDKNGIQFTATAVKEAIDGTQNCYCGALNIDVDATTGAKVKSVGQCSMMSCLYILQTSDHTKLLRLNLHMAVQPIPHVSTNFKATSLGVQNDERPMSLDFPSVSNKVSLLYTTGSSTNQQYRFGQNWFIQVTVVDTPSCAPQQIDVSSGVNLTAGGYYLNQKCTMTLSVAILLGENPSGGCSSYNSYTPQLSYGKLPCPKGVSIKAYNGDSADAPLLANLTCPFHTSSGCLNIQSLNNSKTSSDCIVSSTSGSFSSGDTIFLVWERKNALITQGAKLGGDSYKTVKSGSFLCWMLPLILVPLFLIIICVVVVIIVVRRRRK